MTSHTLSAALAQGTAIQPVSSKQVQEVYSIVNEALPGYLAPKDWLLKDASLEDRQQWAYWLTQEVVERAKSLPFAEFVAFRTRLKTILNPDPGTDAYRERIKEVANEVIAHSRTTLEGLEKLIQTL